MIQENATLLKKDLINLMRKAKNTISSLNKFSEFDEEFTVDEAATTAAMQKIGASATGVAQAYQACVATFSATEPIVDPEEE